MSIQVAFLRAVNVGGTGKLRMARLRQLCESLGLTSVATYIQSGNVVFRSTLSPAKVRAALEQVLADEMGKPVAVAMRTGSELARVVVDNPFPEQPGNRIVTAFYPKTLHPQGLRALPGHKDEQLVLHGRDLYVYYPQGQGASKLKLPQAELATARNLNTVSKVAAMAAELTKAGKGTG